MISSVDYSLFTTPQIIDLGKSLMGREKESEKEGMECITAFAIKVNVETLIDVVVNSDVPRAMFVQLIMRHPRMIASPKLITKILESSATWSLQYAYCKESLLAGATYDYVDLVERKLIFPTSTSQDSRMIHSLFM